MKFFKYLIFSTLFLSSLSYASTYTIVDGSSSFTGSSASEVCNKYISSMNSVVLVSVTESLCSFKSSNGSSVFSRSITKETDDQCPSTVTSTPISVPGWTSWDIDQIDSYSAQISGKTACYQGCKYKNPTMTGSERSDMMSLLYGDPVKDSSCPAGDTTKPSTPTPNNTTPTQMKPEECKSPTGSDGYCNKPSNKQCPAGYKQGSFNNQQICVKPSPDPDPTKPNPNDPNNGKGEGNCNGTNNCNTTNFDDSKIISAINASTSAITQAISSLSNSLSSGFSSVVNAVSSVTNAVNANTSAVNLSGDKVTNAVNGLNSSIQAVSTTVNASADKVTNAVNTNGKNTIDAVNANGEKVTNAVNANGKNTVDAVNTNAKNTVDAVNAGTEATKENGKKLDGIKDGVEKGNGILGEIKDWLFADVDESSFEAKTPMRDLEQKDIESDKYKVSGQCPVSREFSFKGHTFKLDLSNFCYVLDIMGIIIGIAACLHGVAILSENT